MKHPEMSLEPLQTPSTHCTSASSPSRTSRSSQGPAAPDNSVDEDRENSDEYSAQSRDSERTLFYPDLNVLTNDENWTMTPETENYVAAAGSFAL